MGNIFALNQGVSQEGYFRAFCENTISVGDWIYLLPTENKTITKAKANNVSTSNVIGVVIKKPTSTTCIIQQQGFCSIFSSLEKNKKYYLSPITAGEITDTMPEDSGFITKQIGISISTTEIMINIDLIGMIHS